MESNKGGNGEMEDTQDVVSSGSRWLWNGYASGGRGWAFVMMLMESKITWFNNIYLKGTQEREKNDKKGDGHKIGA